MIISIQRFNTKEGEFVARYTRIGLVSLRFPDDPRLTDSPSPVAEESASLADWIELTASALETALNGKEPNVLPTLDFSQATPFQGKVWTALLLIPAGETRTYSQIAQQIDAPKAVRAVGQACGANPIPILIPCHRVVSAGGALGGFSAGLKWKRLLLEREAEAPRSSLHAPRRRLRHQEIRG